MKICCIDYSLASQLEQLGHQVIRLDVGPGLVPLAKFRELAGADLLIQQERLGPRVVLEGLESLNCRTVFISVDTHLNLFWHKYYARLFDLVLTPHLTLFQGLPEKFDNVRRLRHHGYERPWKDYSARAHNISFCGVVNEHRPMRQAMLRLVSSRFALHRPSGPLGHGQMLEMFADTRILPNESISEEVNFRLFEGASCGSLVLSQNIGEDQNVCFEPGKEILTYEHALEFVEKLAFYQANTRVAEKMAKAAWLRVHREHLPGQRSRELLELAKESASAQGGRARGAQAAKCFYLTLLQLSRHGSLVLPANRILRQLMEIDADGETAAATLQLLSEAALPDSPLYRAGTADKPGKEDEYATMGRYFCGKLMKDNLFRDSLACNLAASVYARLQGDSFLAAQFWERQKEALLAAGLPLPQGEFPADPMPESPQGRDGAFYVFWAEVLESAGYLAKPGYRLRSLPGFLPESALECLLLAQAGRDGARLPLAERCAFAARLQRVSAGVRGCAYLSMGFLAQMSLFDQKSWQISLDYGLALLKCLQLEPGLGEIAEARSKAEAAGESETFRRRLEESPASDYILRILE